MIFMSFLLLAVKQDKLARFKKKKHFRASVFWSYNCRLSMETRSLYEVSDLKMDLN
jgi:hypothetical protein